MAILVGVALGVAVGVFDGVSTSVEIGVFVGVGITVCTGAKLHADKAKPRDVVLLNLRKLRRDIGFGCVIRLLPCLDDRCNCEGPSSYK